MASPILRYFDFKHLPVGTPMRKASEKFHALAHDLEGFLPDGPEKSTALRKLLEGKDAAVRSTLDTPVLRPGPISPH